MVWEGNNSKGRTLHNTWELHEIQIPVSINKFYWKQPHPFIYILPLAALVLQRQGWEVATQTTAQKAQNIYYLPHLRKSLPNSILDIVIKGLHNMSLGSNGQQQNHQGYDHWKETCSDEKIWNVK